MTYEFASQLPKLVLLSFGIIFAGEFMIRLGCYICALLGLL